MGRFSRPLSVEFADWLDLREGQKALDVGCGPGALTEVLADRLGAASVTGVDPSEPFVEAARERLPGVTVVQASAESLPFDDGAFDRTRRSAGRALHERPGRPACASCVA